MGQYSTPRLKHVVDVVPTSLPLPGALIAGAMACVAMILFTLGYATYAQLSGIEVKVSMALPLCLFGFLLPSVNMYLISRAKPAGRWFLLVNLVGINLVLLYIFGRVPGLAVGIVVSAFVLTLIEIYVLVFSRRVQQYYRAVRTGIVDDNRVLRPLLREKWIRVAEKVLYPLAEIAVVILALLVFAWLFLFQRFG